MILSEFASYLYNVWISGIVEFTIVVPLEHVYINSKSAISYIITLFYSLLLLKLSTMFVISVLVYILPLESLSYDNAFSTSSR